MECNAAAALTWNIGALIAVALGAAATWCCNTHACFLDLSRLEVNVLRVCNPIYDQAVSTNQCT